LVFPGSSDGFSILVVRRYSILGRAPHRTSRPPHGCSAALSPPLDDHRALCADVATGKQQATPTYPLTPFSLSLRQGTPYEKMAQKGGGNPVPALQEKVGRAKAHAPPASLKPNLSRLCCVSLRIGRQPILSMHACEDDVALPCTAAPPPSNRRQPHMPATREDKGMGSCSMPPKNPQRIVHKNPRLKISTHHQVGVGVYFSASANETGTLIVKSIIKGSPAFKSNKISVTGNPLP
jgi:hypothetical protein